MHAPGEGVAAALPPPREGKFVGKHAYFGVVGDQQSKLTRLILHMLWPLLLREVF
jgi:hypothetical protein